MAGNSITDGLPAPQRRLAVAVIATGAVMTVLDASIANVALPTIARELRIDAASSVWVVNAYQVAVMVLLLPFASLGDVIGYRPVYAGGIALFTLGSFACASATTLPLLVLARVVQGVGGAAVMSIAPALMRTIFSARMLGVAVGISALTVAGSSAAGPTLGGAILAIAPWPWIFAINVPLGLADTLFALRVLPRDPQRGGRFDVPSALLSGPALASFVLALDGFARSVPLRDTAPALLASAVLGIAFVRRQRGLSSPMLPLDLFAMRRFSLATGTSLCSFTAQGIAFVALPFLLQGVYGYSAFASALLFTPWPLAIACVAPFAGRLADRVPAPQLTTAGLAVFAIGLAALAALSAHPETADIVWRAVVCGLGFGFFQAPNNREIMGAAPRERSGSVSGILATVRLTGQSVGAALVAIAIGTSAASHAGASSVALAGPTHAALWIASSCALVAMTVSAARLHSAGSGTVRA